jgi:endonuclease/exonuclease/phosphatase family metal-dependent hydrolase
VSSTLSLLSHNIHKGVSGVGPTKRLQLHGLREALQGLKPDLIALQEVRLHHRGDARRFHHHGWPAEGQADYLAPEGYEVAYRSNARTRGGEHGNALLSRWPLGHIHQHDVSDHRLEQRGILHVEVDRQGGPALHVLVLHLGLFHGSRVRQIERLGRYIEAEVPADAPLIATGDFNDWREQLDPALARLNLERAGGERGRALRSFPARAPLFALDRAYLRGLRCREATVLRGAPWNRLSDHLPLLVELELAP